MIKLTRDDIIRIANKIRIDYREQGLKLTIRQMYYQFVARGYMESGQKNYKRIVNGLSSARLSGRYPLDGVEDRGRSVTKGAFTRRDDQLHIAEFTARQRIQQLPQDLIGFDRWWGQPNHVSVWVEKEALTGVFESPCYDLGVSMFACKGYPSLSALYDWVIKTQQAMHFWEMETREFGYRNIDMQFREVHEGRARRAIILYFGDHDPDGWEIPRASERNLRDIQGVMRAKWAAEQHDAMYEGPYDPENAEEEAEEDIEAREGDYPFWIPIEFKRIALNMDQIREFDPPPFEAKMTSSRYQGYRDEHDTDEAWELDALDPAVLRQLIREHVGLYFDDDIHNENEDRAERVQDELRDLMTSDGWMVDAMKDE